MEISELELTSQKALELNSLLNEEWPDVGDFEKTKYGVTIPKPISAMKNGELIGGLSFTTYNEPSGESVVVWVNTVFVVPKFRRKGVASELIKASTRSASRLYALTDIPGLYTKIGWQIEKSDCNGAVVKYDKNT